MIDLSHPFVLFDDASPGANALARLYEKPRAVVSALAPEDVSDALAQIRAAQRNGLHAAGWLAYEAGLALEPRLLKRLAGRPRAQPLLWFGLFETCREIDAETLADPESAWPAQLSPRISEQDYHQAIGRTLHQIEAGDVYQLNLTFRADFEMLGSPLALYAQIRKAGAGAWSGIVFDGNNYILSTSPEQFFSLRAGRITTRPMKGTATRGADPASDALVVKALATDEKQRAENLMIVDLLRNDLSRVAVNGSVRVQDMFKVETYPTLHAMTSTIMADLKEGLDAVDVLKALFPCGSVTGAPKIRAMELIDELETEPRGAYTGSMGWIGPNGDASFNVLIRTIEIEAATPRARLGLGSGVVYDSTPPAEWRECLAKAAFVHARRPRFDLIETMLFEPGVGIVRLAGHLERLSRSAAKLGFAFDRQAIAAQLLQDTTELLAQSRVRLTLSVEGKAHIACSPAPAAIEGEAAVALAKLPVHADDFRLRHKTTSRDFYDVARQNAQAFEVVFYDAHGFITEGSFTNVFVKRGDSLLTPPAARGLLPGVLRAHLLESGAAIESELRTEDLLDGFYIGNTLRWLMPARLIAG